MIKPHAFQGMTASIFPSQDGEITVSKQAVLAEYGREVRLALNQLPPDVSKQLLSAYQKPTVELIRILEEAITSREFAIDNAAKEANLDQQWAADKTLRQASDLDLHSQDEWN